jgi:NAD(P)-dependent dehydrogenase (short-subunit alcohol dehydrogenase family)
LYRSTPLEALSADHWDADLDVNLRSAFLCAHAAVPALRAAGGGRIINFADWLARSGRPNYKGFTSYYTAKAGVIALTESLALELARDKILVNAIAPAQFSRRLISARKRSPKWPRRLLSAAGAARRRSRRRCCFSARRIS